MKHLLKKSLAVILTALMLMSTVPITISAAEDYGVHYNTFEDIDVGQNNTTSYPKLISAKSVYGGVNIEWSSYGSAYAYRVFSYGENSWHHLGTTTSTSFFDSEVVSGKTYIYTVRAIDKNRNNISDYDHNGIKVTYFKSPEIKAAQSLKDGLKLTFDTIGGVYAYKVFYQSQDGWKGIGTTTSNSFVYAGADSGTKYTYTVRGIDKNGDYITGFNSSGFKATFIATPVVNKIENTANGIKLSWNSVKGAAQYRVFRYGEDGWKNFGVTSKTTFEDTNVSSGITYTYTVRCLDENRNFISDYNNSGWKQTFFSVPKISSLTCTSNGVKISWNKVPGAVNYKVYYKSESGWTGLGFTTQTSFVDTHVSSGQTYTYTVRCFTADGKSHTSYYDTTEKK